MPREISRHPGKMEAGTNTTHLVHRFAHPLGGQQLKWILLALLEDGQKLLTLAAYADSGHAAAETSVKALAM